MKPEAPPHQFKASKKDDKNDQWSHEDIVKEAMKAKHTVAEDMDDWARKKEME